jgi:hypothetical protein
MDKWIENQAKALADYASEKYQGPYLYSEAHDHLRLYAEDCLREAQEQVKREDLREAVRLQVENTKLREALENIEAFGHSAGHGRGYTCGTMAAISLALQEKG